MDEIETGDNFMRSMSSHYLNVGIAISGSKNCKCAVRWALDKFAPRGNVIMKLIHVCSRIVGVPAEMREDVAADYMREIEWNIVLPYKRMCAKAKVEVDVVIVESEDVPNAIAAEVAKLAITKLVIGASSRGIFSRKLKGLSTKISACVPSFCTVYAVSKGKLSSVRRPDTDTVVSSIDDNSDTHSVVSDTHSVVSDTHSMVSDTHSVVSDTHSEVSDRSYASSSQTDRSSVASSTNFSSPSLTMQRFQALTTMNQNLLKTRKDSFDRYHSRYRSPKLDERKDGNTGTCTRPSYIGRARSQASSSGSLVTDSNSFFSDLGSISDVATECSSSESQINVNFELEKLRIELRHAKGMYEMAQSESNDASRKLKDLNMQLLDEVQKLEEINIKEEETKELLREEKEKLEAAKREARCVMKCVEREAALKIEADTKAANETKERKKLEAALTGSAQQYKDFTWEEIVSATSSFSEDLKIGIGGYGTIYKCSFHHTTVAVKVLHSNESHKTKQFQQELEILSTIHHPHLLLLIGACPDRGCLVYEYMENGSLDDRLAQKNNTPPIPWFDRYRIAWEVASALAFLHNSKPKPIIHRDLKPANILLDRNLVSKIGDVGLAAMIHLDHQASASTMYRDTGPVGTLCYIDPEYQRTGQISPKSDVYALGMVILQLLTAKPAIALAHVVETAVADGKLAEILDQKAGKWPDEETKQLAELGLGCVELRRRDRPDLQDQVLPSLLRLKEVADKARDSVSNVQNLLLVPSHFMCPILKDVMNDPCVASDGYTYDRKAIETWLEANDTSPMTNLPLLSKTLIPNYTLLSAIVEWKSKEA